MKHCCSYEKLKLWKQLSLVKQSQDQSWRCYHSANISPDVFYPYMAADNNDFNEETIAGKSTTQAMTFIAFLRKQHPLTTPPIEFYADHSRRKRYIDSSSPIVRVEDIGVGRRRPAVTIYVNKLTNATCLQRNDTFHSA